jgi:serine/threonine protein kinase
MALEDYDLGDLVGAGSSAQVYWAHRIRDSALVAIKVIDKLQVAQLRKQSKSQAKSEDLQEIVIQRQLRHPNVLQILDVFEDNRNVFIVLEPCLKGSLYTLISSRYGPYMHPSRHNNSSLL